MINKKETKMSLAIIGIALVATVITMSTPIPTLLMGHWNSDEDYVSNTGFTDLTISPPPLVKSAFADHGQEIVVTSKDGQKTVFTSKDSLTSKDSQTITNPSIQPPTTMTTTTTPVTYVVEEICNDGIDNDSDTLIDFSDEECNPLQSQQQPILSQQQPILSQQGQTMVSTSEICDDDLDNDFDGKVDSRDDECNSITTTSSSFPPPIQGQPVNDEQIGEENGDKEQQSNEDVSDESGEKEDSDDEDNNEEDDSNDDENEDEDEE